MKPYHSVVNKMNNLSYSAQNGVAMFEGLAIWFVVMFLIQKYFH